MYRKAAEQGHASAQNTLGWMHAKGDGVVQSYVEAVRWYKKAAKQGDANAQLNLGSMYENGDGVAQSHAEALRWYRKAAEQGDAGAQFFLGLMYGQGKGVAGSVRISVCEAVGLFSVTVRRPLTVLPVPAR